MNCVRWSIGDASFHGMGTSLVPHQDFRCHPCPPTKMLPMSPDRTRTRLTPCFRGPAPSAAEHARWAHQGGDTMNNQWRQEKRGDFGWSSIDGATEIKAFWLAHAEFADPARRRGN